MVAYFPTDVRLEVLGEDGACFDRKSGVTHVMDAAGAVILQQIISQPGISRDDLLAQLVASFEDDPAALEQLLANALALLAQKGVMRASVVPDAYR